MLSSLRCYLRDRRWDISRGVEWLEEAQPYYEMPETVARYDVAALEAGETTSVSTFKHPTSHELIAELKARGARSVLDIGCGAGAFYHLLARELPDVRYLGIDVSSAQIARARQRYGERFELRDASTLTVGDFREFDAVHEYSVFPFMALEKQLALLDRIMASGALTILGITATLPDPAFVPRRLFFNYGKREVNGARFLTAVTFPYRNEIARLVRPPYRATWSELEIARPFAVNGSGRDGGALYRGRRPRMGRNLFKRLRGVIRSVG